jgi:hypothetical protein
MTGWLTALRDHPIAEQQRRTALAASAVVLIAMTVLLVLTRPSTHTAPARAAAETSTIETATADPAPPSPETLPDGALSPEATAASRSFLAGYLAYTYGSAPASRIDDADRSLIESLRAHPPRVSPAMRASLPRVLELYATPAPSGQLGVSAVVNDGGLIDYAIGLTLARLHGQLLVTGMEQG